MVLQNYRGVVKVTTRNRNPAESASISAMNAQAAHARVAVPIFEYGFAGSDSVATWTSMRNPLSSWYSGMSLSRDMMMNACNGKTSAYLYKLRVAQSRNALCKQIQCAFFLPRSSNIW